MSKRQKAMKLLTAQTIWIQSPIHPMQQAKKHWMWPYKPRFSCTKMNDLLFKKWRDYVAKKHVSSVCKEKIMDYGYI
jgi:hypothetical protein